MCRFVSAEHISVKSNCVRFDKTAVWAYMLHYAACSNEPYYSLTTTIHFCNGYVVTHHSVHSHGFSTLCTIDPCKKYQCLIEKKIISKKSNWILSWKREMKMFWFLLCQTSSGSIHFWCIFCAKVKLPLTKGIFYACLLNLWWRSMCMWKAEGMQLEAWVSTILLILRFTHIFVMSPVNLHLRLLSSNS